MPRVTKHKRPFAERDKQILALYDRGEKVAVIALRFGIHKSRTYKIITREQLRGTT